MSDDARLQSAVAEIAGAEVRALRPVAGGDINAAHLADLADGRTVFVKSHRLGTTPPPGLYAAEAEGLRALADAVGDRADALRVPAVLGFDEACLMLDAVAFTPGPADFEAQLGRGLATLHRNSAGRGPYGSDRPSFLGRWPQPPVAEPDFVGFWRDHRLLPWAGALPAGHGLADPIRRLADRLPALLDGAADEPVCLIHGDLWSGNAAWADGATWIYDPATYRAPREVEFGMTRLFGFGRRFEDAYREVWPLPEGWERRTELYTLHHLLSHAWHFDPPEGGGYAGQARGVMARLLER